MWPPKCQRKRGVIAYKRHQSKQKFPDKEHDKHKELQISRTSSWICRRNDYQEKRITRQAILGADETPPPAPLLGMESNSIKASGINKENWRRKETSPLWLWCLSSNSLQDWSLRPQWLRITKDCSHQHKLCGTVYWQLSWKIIPKTNYHEFSWHHKEKYGNVRSFLSVLEKILTLSPLPAAKKMQDSD